MPVTAKLSRRFYETFGDEIANELVEGFNQVDLTYRTDLRELNELNFARSEARADQRAAALEAKMAQRAAELDATIDRRTAELEAKIGQRAAELDAKIDRRTAELEAKIEQRTDELRGELRQGLADLRSELVKWMFVFWAGNVATTLGVAAAVIAAARR